jgi:hypothetical protein
MGQILNELGSTLESENSERRAWERGAIDANICKEDGNADEIGEFIGTAFVARDILRVAEAISEDGLIRYWGEYCPGLWPGFDLPLRLSCHSWERR